MTPAYTVSWNYKGERHTLTWDEKQYAENFMNNSLDPKRVTEILLEEITK